MTARTIDLQPFWEYRFEVAFGSPGITVKLQKGTAEKDGTELAPGNTYRFTATKSHILTLQGCTLEVDGKPEEEWIVKDQPPSDNIANMHANIHFKLRDERVMAGQTHRHGPRVLVTGTPNSGKTTCVRTLAAYATRQGDQPCVVNLNPEEGMLSVAGTLSAAVFASMMDLEARGKWGTSPSSGPSDIPAKLPIVHFYGQRTPEAEPAMYKLAVSALSGAVSARLTADPEVKKSGLIINTAGVNPRDNTSLGLLAHIISEFSGWSHLDPSFFRGCADVFSVNIVIVIDSGRLEESLKDMFKNEQTSLDEPITVVGINKSKELPAADDGWTALEREAEIKEYFFGDAKAVLSPFTQQVRFDKLTVYKVPETSGRLADLGGAADGVDDGMTLTRVEPDYSMHNWTLAVMQASVKDPPEAVRSAPVLSFVYAAEVNEDKEELRLLGSGPGTLGEHPMIWGKWPEANVDLLG
jgi:polyribonucleotide 5'-hydroxyl-kinase